MRWAVENLKGLAMGELNLGQGMITVLAGANSSGKSSLIQSLLMIAQSNNGSGRVSLNGHLTRLGLAKDVIREDAESITLSITLDASEVLGWEPGGSQQHGVQQSDVKAQFELAADPDRPQNARLESVKISGPTPEMSLLFSRRNARDLDKVADIVGCDSSQVLHLKETGKSARHPLRTYLIFNALSPVAIVRLQTPKQSARDFKRDLTILTGGRRADPGFASRAYDIERQIGTIAADLNLNIAGGLDRRSPASYGFSVLRHLDSLDSIARTELIEILSEGRARSPYFVQPLETWLWRGTSLRLRNVRGEMPADFADYLEILDLVSRKIGELSGGVSYLGPLRDEPRVVWGQWSQQSIGLPVGARGELTAAVFDNLRSRKVSCRLANEKEAGNYALSAAVDSWLAHLRIGESVDVENRGKLGIGFELKVGRGGVRDLTSVGVGVSQALPVIVGLLTAAPGATFLVEQPELHLHPATQARLADFLLYARPDVSVVIETHSEALLTRIRLRVARGEASPEQVNITFVENREGGAMSRSLSMNHYGDLLEWPQGFFDDDGDLTALMEAKVRRVRGELNDA